MNDSRLDDSRMERLQKSQTQGGKSDYFFSLRYGLRPAGPGGPPDSASSASADVDVRINASRLLVVSDALTAMLGWAQILRTHQLDEATVELALASIERSAQAQSHLIEDMLDVSRIVSGKLNLNMHALDLRSVVEAAIQAIHLAIAAKSIQMVSHLTSAMVIGDSDRLQQVVWNLLSNAIKFTPSGGHLSITVASTQTDAEIRVSDTGKGIPADQLPYIFERFRQGDSSPSKASQGLGLGLSIVRHIIELHGGTVRAESPGEGKGATMIVRLPLRSTSLAVMPASGLEPVVEDVIGEAVGQEILFLEGLHILAVDDNLDSLTMMKYMLENIGAEVTLG
jgi:two-component system CheB/CheR fusion protein